MRSGTRLVASGGAAPPSDSSHRVDAAIVRALKAGGRLRGGVLASLVEEALGAAVDEGLLRKRVESLVEREYIRFGDRESQALPFAQQVYEYFV